MRVIEPSFEIMNDINGMEVLKHIERCARTCYKSEDRITDISCVQMVKNLIARGHEAMLEHYSFSVRFICDRGVSHEIVRHRLASFAQESTRYCNYSKDKFDDGITLIRPCFFDDKEDYEVWERAMFDADYNYRVLMEHGASPYGASPEQARSVLPNSLKTEVIMTANLREWRHFLKLRTAKAAHPQMRQLTVPLLAELKALIPVVFDDIIPEV